MNNLEHFNEIKAQLTVFVSPIKEMTISKKEELEAASATLRELKRIEKKIEEKRKELVGPLNDQVKQINEYSKQIREPLDNAEAHLKAQLRAFEALLEVERQAQMKAELEERKRREAEAMAKIKAAEEEAASLAMFESADNAELLKAQAAADAERIAFEAKKAGWDAKKEIQANKVSGATRRWVFEVIDESLVPREYLTVNETAIRKFVAAGVREIPGVKIFQELSISAR